MMDLNDIVLSTHDAATLAAVIATYSPREEPPVDAMEELTDKLAGAQIVADAALARDVVTLEAEVTYRELPAGSRRTVRLVHPAAADPSAARVSVFAPVGRALLGHRAGARIPVALPDGSIDELHVVAVTPRRQS